MFEQEREGHEFQRLRKNSILNLILGGAAVYLFTAAVNACFDRAFRR
jgi:hypothetical protein